MQYIISLVSTCYSEFLVGYHSFFLSPWLSNVVNSIYIRVIRFITGTMAMLYIILHAKYPLHGITLFIDNSYLLTLIFSFCLVIILFFSFFLILNRIWNSRHFFKSVFPPLGIWAALPIIIRGVGYCLGAMCEVAKGAGLAGTTAVTTDILQEWVGVDSTSSYRAQNIIKKGYNSVLSQLPEDWQSQLPKPETNIKKD